MLKIGRFAAALAVVCSQHALAENGVTKDSIVLGQSVALTGAAAQLGIQMRSGVKAYFDYVNERGGVNGRKLELITLDDGYEPARTVPNTKKLIEEDKVFALIGYVGTPTSLPAVPLFTEAKVPFIGPFTGAESLRTPFNRYIFHLRASYYDETEKIVEQIVLNGGTKVAVFYQDDAYGQAGLKGVELALAKRDMKVAALGTVERNTAKVGSAVKAIAAIEPNAVVMVCVYTSCAEFVRQMKKAGSAAQLYSLSFVGSNALASALGKDGAGVGISQVVPFPWSSSVQAVREYQQLSAKGGNEDFNFGAIEGFLVAKVFVEGVKRTGKNLTREGFIDAMEKMQDVDLGGFYVSYSPKNHVGSKFVDLTSITREGKFMH
jgi:ABC-type branched-subunit amino acid transport system substrate-binding protein